MHEQACDSIDALLAKQGSFTVAEMRQYLKEHYHLAMTDTDPGRLLPIIRERIKVEKLQVGLPKVGDHGKRYYPFQKGGSNMQDGDKPKNGGATRGGGSLNLDPSLAVDAKPPTSVDVLPDYPLANAFGPILSTDVHHVDVDLQIVPDQPATPPASSLEATAPGQPATVEANLPDPEAEQVEALQNELLKLEPDNLMNRKYSPDVLKSMSGLGRLLEYKKSLLGQRERARERQQDREEGHRRRPQPRWNEPAPKPANAPETPASQHVRLAVKPAATFTQADLDKAKADGQKAAADALKRTTAPAPTAPAVQPAASQWPSLRLMIGLAAAAVIVLTVLSVGIATRGFGLGAADSVVTDIEVLPSLSGEETAEELAPLPLLQLNFE